MFSVTAKDVRIVATNLICGFENRMCLSESSVKGAVKVRTLKTSSVSLSMDKGLQNSLREKSHSHSSTGFSSFQRPQQGIFYVLQILSN